MAHLSFKRRTCAILVAIFFLTYIYQQIRITRRPFRMPGAEHGYAKTAQSLYSGHKKSDRKLYTKDLRNILAFCNLRHTLLLNIT